MREITEKKFVWTDNWKFITFTGFFCVGIYQWVLGECVSKRHRTPSVVLITPLFTENSGQEGRIRS